MLKKLARPSGGVILSLGRVAAHPSLLRSPHRPHVAQRRRVRPCTPLGSHSTGNHPAMPDAAQQPGPEASGAAAVERPDPGSSSLGGPGAPQQQTEQHGKQAGPAAQPAQRATWQRLLLRTVQTVWKNLWPILLVHLVCDVLVFGLHRLSHRLTNEVAVRVLGPAVTPATIGNMWWLSPDSIATGVQRGYQALTFAVFLLAFPANVLLKSTASIYSILVCEGRAPPVERPWWQALGALRQSLGAVRGLRQAVGQVWKRVFLVELFVAAVVVPLQFASMAVVTLPLTLPLILDLQAAGPAAVLEGVRGMGAVQRSRQLIKPLRWSLAAPFVGVVVALRLVEEARGLLLTVMPPRYYRELLEIPLAVMVLGAVASMLLHRFQDILPYVAYKEAVAQEAQQQQQGQQGKQEQGRQQQEQQEQQQQQEVGVGDGGHLPDKKPPAEQQQEQEQK